MSRQENGGLVGREAVFNGTRAYITTESMIGRPENSVYSGKISHQGNTYFWRAELPGYSMFGNEYLCRVPEPCSDVRVYGEGATPEVQKSLSELIRHFHVRLHDRSRADAEAFAAANK